MTLKERRSQVAEDRFKAEIPENTPPQAPTVQASYTPWGTPQFVVVTGSEGGLRSQAGPTYRDDFEGMVVPGETVSAATLVRNSDSLKGPSGKPWDWIDTPHRVKVTWTVQCAGKQKHYDLGQEVMTHSGVWASYYPPDDEPILRFETTVDPEQCSGMPNPTFVVMAHATVVDVEDGGTGTSPADAYVVESIPGDQTRGCAPDPCASATTAFAQPQSHRGISVNSATGAFTDAFTDADQSAAGGGLNLTRFYASDNGTAGSLGPGWTFPWDAHLTTDVDGNVTLVSEAGAKYQYSKDGSAYKRPATSRSTLKQRDGGGYTLTTPSQRTFAFDTDGQLTSSKDRAGRGLEFTYEQGRLASIKDAAGRTSRVSYTGDLLTRIAMPDGRHVDYGYAEGRLKTVTGTDRKTVTYSYDAEGRLASVQDAKGHFAVRNTYDAQGRVISQLDAAGEETSFAYKGTETDTTMPDGGIWTDIHIGNILTAQYDPFGNKTYFAYDGQANITRITNPLGNKTNYNYDSRGRLTAAETASGADWKYTYDALGNISKFTDGERNATTYAYNAKNLPETTTDALAQVTKFAYTSTGRLQTVTDALGKQTRYGYNTAGDLTSVTYPNGARATQSFDGSGRLTSITDPRGNADGANPQDYTSTYTYDDADRLLTSTDAKGRTTKRTYDDAGNLASLTDADNETTTYTYDAANRLTDVKDPAGNIVKQTYDKVGRLASITDATGGKTTYTYDKAGRMVSMTTPRGNASGADPANFTWTYGYDKAGNQTTVTDPAGNTTLTTYDVENRPTRVTDPLGNIKITKYDDVGNVVGTTDARGKSTTLTYDDNYQLVSVKDRAYKTVTYTYDAVGNLTSETTPLGFKTTYGYDALGRVTDVVEPRGNITGADPAQYTWHTDYDAAGNATSQTDPLDNRTVRAYDSVNNLVELTDPRGKKTTYGYDALDRLTEVTAPDGGITSLGYDSVGNLTSRTDPNNQTTTFGYDSAGRTTRITDPLDRASTVTYDPDGNRSTVTNARGQVATSTYTAQGRLSKTTYSDGTPTVGYTYDAAGWPKTITDATGTRTVTYDAEHRPLTITSPGAANPFKYTYNNDGTIRRRTYPDGRATYFTYDADKRIIGRTTNSKKTTYAWDESGNLTSTLFPTSTARAETRTYDRAGQLASVSEESGARHYTRDANGRVVADTFTDASTTGPAKRYGYDDAGRLTRACTDAAASSCLDGTAGNTYTYDKVGNLTAAVADGKTTTNTYDAANQLIKAVTGSSITDFAHDADGNRTKDAKGTYAYDALGRVKSASIGADSFTFSYDADGNRTTAKKNNTLVRTSRWDVNRPLAQIATETDGAGALIADYRYNPLGVPDAMDRTGGTFYFQHDRQESVTSVYDAAGAEQYTYTYDEWGSTIGKASTADGQSSIFGYTGQYKDPYLTGQLDLRARDYDPETRRFTTTDPIRAGPDNPNSSPYAYANNDPANLSDPSGRCPFCVGVVIGAVIGGAIEGGIYSWQHRNDDNFSWGGLAKASGKGALYGAAAGVLMPGSGNLAARALGLSGGRALATKVTVNATVGAGFSWGLNEINCRPTDPQDLLLGAAGGGLSSLVGPAFNWLKSLRGGKPTTNPFPAIQVSPKAIVNPKTVYRGDARDPSLVFKSGFQAKAGDGNLDLRQYGWYNTPSAWVGTSYRPSLAAMFPQKAKGTTWVYEIRSPGTGINMNKALGFGYVFRAEKEVVFPGGIDPTTIVRAVRWSWGMPTKQVVENPGYVPR
ncbi:scabin-related ADP-ribosyltransferase [Streptomyces sp. O3]